MTDHVYRHTQIGWVTIASLGIASAVLAGVLLAAELHGLLTAVLVFLLLMLVLFATLTVTVDRHHLRFHFGPGLLGKRLALAEIRHYSAVRNPWSYGWGIHFTPAGILYNVSGLDAVQLQLKDGRRLRLGTDEPDALCRALETVLGPSEPLTPNELAQARRSARKALLVLAAVLVVIVSLVATLFLLQEQPPRVALGADAFRVTSVFYSQEFAYQDITELSLEPRLPRIRLRTNGYAAGGTLRGHFRLEALGDGQLFVERRHPPYVFVHRGSDFVFVNFEDPDDTRTLFRELSQRREAARDDGAR